MLSRVAETIYWMTRYIERVENYARLLGANINISMDLPHSATQSWDHVLWASSDRISYLNSYEKIEISKVLDFLCFDPNNAFSMSSSLYYARENARGIRETLPKEVWEHINTFYLEFKELQKNKPKDIGAWMNAFETIKFRCQLFYGIVDGSLSRKAAYYFFNVGKFIERADKTSRFLDIGRLNDKPQEELNSEDLLIWTGVLKSVSAYNMYRQQHKNLSKGLIINFLVSDILFPRSLNFCTYKVNEAFEKIGLEPNSELYETLKKLKEIAGNKEVSKYRGEKLADYIDRFQSLNNALDRTLIKQYF